MKKLHEKVNIVPVIAKADTLMPKEMAKIKAKVSRKTRNTEHYLISMPELIYSNI